MKIGELARRSGLTASRIRFYEASGLIAAQRLGNGYRDYPEQALAVLELIACGQQAGFSLEEMRHLLPSPGQVHGNHERMLEACGARWRRSRPCRRAWWWPASASCR